MNAECAEMRSECSQVAVRMRKVFPLDFIDSSRNMTELNSAKFARMQSNVGSHSDWNMRELGAGSGGRGTFGPLIFPRISVLKLA